MTMPRRRWWMAGAAGAVLGLWLVLESPWAAAPGAGTGVVPLVGGARGTPPLPDAGAAAASATGDAATLARLQQLQLWQERLASAEATLKTYRESTRYPHDSRPIGEQPDQVFPNEPIAEDHPLRMPNSAPVPGVRLRTTQERVYLQGAESVRFTVSLVDGNGRVQPLRVQRASVKEALPPSTASLYPEVPVAFSDEGQAGDQAANDGVHTLRLQPSAQGFAGLLGALRVEVQLQYDGRPGFTYFEVSYSPEAPAAWLGGAQGGVREQLDAGSLNLYLKAAVRLPGRYVVSGRIDDANGKPFALVGFNDEVEPGTQEFRLSVFGRLVRDGKPALPLVLRDVEAFLLRPDAHPDRLLMPRLAGKVHTSRGYALADFSDAEWSSEERDRYLAELSKDVNEAQDQVAQLQR